MTHVTGCLVQHVIWGRQMAGSSKLVLAAMSDLSIGAKHRVIVSIEELRRRTGLSRSAVQRSLRVLERDHEIELVTRGGGRGISSAYDLRCDEPQKAPAD